MRDQDKEADEIVNDLMAFNEDMFIEAMVKFNCQIKKEGRHTFAKDFIRTACVARMERMIDTVNRQTELKQSQALELELAKLEEKKAKYESENHTTMLGIVNKAIQGVKNALSKV